MNGESDKPAAVLIGIADEDASELPPLQPPRSSGKAKKTRQIPGAGILDPELDASNGMSLSYQARESEEQGGPCSIRITRPGTTISVRSTAERCPARSAAGKVQWRDRFPRRRYCPPATS